MSKVCILHFSMVGYLGLADTNPILWNFVINPDLKKVFKLVAQYSDVNIVIGIPVNCFINENEVRAFDGDESYCARLKWVKNTLKEFGLPSSATFCIFPVESGKTQINLAALKKLGLSISSAEDCIIITADKDYITQDDGMSVMETYKEGTLDITELAHFKKVQLQNYPLCYTLVDIDNSLLLLRSSAFWQRTVLNTEVLKLVASLGQTEKTRNYYFSSRDHYLCTRRQEALAKEDYDTLVDLLETKQYLEGQLEAYLKKDKSQEQQDAVQKYNKALCYNSKRIEQTNKKIFDAIEAYDLQNIYSIASIKRELSLSSDIKIREAPYSFLDQVTTQRYKYEEILPRLEALSGFVSRTYPKGARVLVVYIEDSSREIDQFKRNMAKIKGLGFDLHIITVRNKANIGVEHLAELKCFFERSLRFAITREVILSGLFRYSPKFTPTLPTIVEEEEHELQSTI